MKATAAPLVFHRVWTLALNDDAPPALGAPFRFYDAQQAWRPGYAERGAYAAHSTDHALKYASEFEVVSNVTGFQAPLVVGRVALWGRVGSSERELLASFGYPVAFERIVHGADGHDCRDLLEQLRDRYQLDDLTIDAETGNVSLAGRSVRLPRRAPMYALLEAWVAGFPEQLAEDDPRDLTPLAHGLIEIAERARSLPQPLPDVLFTTGMIGKPAQILGREHPFDFSEPNGRALLIAAATALNELASNSPPGVRDHVRAQIRAALETAPIASHTHHVIVDILEAFGLRVDAGRRLF